LVLGVNHSSRQELDPGPLGSAQSPISLLLQGHQECLISHAIAHHKGFNLAQPAIRPSQMSTRLKLWGECHR
jgi:hypothetical protein